MPNETESIDVAVVSSTASAGPVLPALEPRVIAAGPAARPPPNSPILKARGDDALMAFCDGHFLKLMDSARCKPELPAASSGDDVKAPKPGMVMGDPAVLARYLEKTKAAKPPPNRMMKRAIGKALSSKKLERGLGGRVYIGFDAEWVYPRKGRNRILSVQFHLIGPTGEVLTMVIHVGGRDGVEERPSLRQTLDELLEKAENAGVIEDWPAEVVLCGFFTRADITVFSDFRKLRPQLQGVGGTLVTIGKPAQVELPMSPKREMELKSRYQYVVGDAFDPKLLSVRLVDASRLAPPGKSLASLGQWLGIPKIDLPAGYTKDDMATFQRKEPKKFEAYGLRDAEIAAMYVLWVVWFSTRYLGLDMEHLSATASGVAVRVAEDCIRKDGVALDVALNFEQVKFFRWNKKTDRGLTVKKRVPTRIRRWLEPFLADAYIGGRNECFVFGPTARKRFYDPDLFGAYLTGLGYPFVLAYKRAFMTTDKKAFKGHVAGFALVTFSFPAGTRFPCLPVSVESRGLLFPMSGESLATAPEIELAMEMGAEITVEYGVVIPWMDRDKVFAESQARNKGRPQGQRSKPGEGQRDLNRDGDDLLPADEEAFPPPHHGDTGYRIFESFAINIHKKRSKFARKSLPFDFVKLLGNSLYGKTGQGFKGKRAFGPREMAGVIVGPSRVSEAAVAALVCGFVRAVLGEILWKLPPDTEVVSATTDGFLVSRPLNQLDLSGEMCQRFQTLVDRFAPGGRMLENKHQVVQVVAMRTRGQITGEADGDNDIVVAKAGVKPGLEIVKGTPPAQIALDENSFMMDLFLDRQPGQKLSYESFIPMRDQLPLGYDLQLERHEVKLNLEFDFKRKPLYASAHMQEVSGTGKSHLAFETEPWDNVEHAAMTRMIFDKWKETGCLKTLVDLKSFQHFLAMKMGNQRRAKAVEDGDLDVEGATRCVTGRVNLTKDGPLGAVKRAFLSAYVKGAWGLAGADLSQSRLAEWLSSVGYATKLSAVKNGTRALLNEHVVPPADDVMAFLNVVKARFPDLEIERFLTGDV